MRQARPSKTARKVALNIITLTRTTRCRALRSRGEVTWHQNGWFVVRRWVAAGAGWPGSSEWLEGDTVRFAAHSAGGERAIDEASSILHQKRIPE